MALTPDDSVHRRVQASVDTLREKLVKGRPVYGVNTGFGGSANTRTSHHASLQKALLQALSSAVLLPQDCGRAVHGTSIRSDFSEVRSHSIPTSWVKAAMLTRCNSLLRGHSGVRVLVIDHILCLLKQGMTPVVPLRGSISASGDLTPLSYVAGVLEGNPDLSVVNEKNGQIIPADEALRELGLPPIDLGPKEGLGLLNGTAFSAGTGAMVLYDVSQLLLLSHVLTAMGTEALGGSRENYHPFISEARPHDGQRESASTIFSFLSDSKLATMTGEPEDDCEPTTIRAAKLAQSRYALRTSPQWIGPQIEDISLALQQVHCELNSTTDNPLIDPANDEIHHGGNFQAVSVTSAMQKAQNALQMLGKMLFSQCSEVINPDLSNGLPPNLSMDDPSLSFTCKGIDINMASYMSELAYLNHSVSNYVQSAEMHNQSLNSLAFITCRYANDAVEILSLMSAAYIFVLCQALDLRALYVDFIRDARVKVDQITKDIGFPAETPSSDPQLIQAQESVWGELINRWLANRTSDLHQNCVLAARHSVSTFIDHVPDGHLVVQKWKDAVSEALEKSYQTTRAAFLRNPTTKDYLCTVSCKFYSLVRDEIGVPVHEGLVEHPTYNAGQREQHWNKRETIGTRVSKIYTALRHGKFRDTLASCWDPVQENGIN